MTYEDMAIGKVLKGTIARLDARGLRVRLSRGLYGTCTADHVTDKNLKRPLEKVRTLHRRVRSAVSCVPHCDTPRVLMQLAVGQALQFVVIESEPVRQKLLLSLKQSLVQSSLQVASRHVAITCRSEHICASAPTRHVACASAQRVCSYEEATPGTATHGVIKVLKAQSVVISLLGGVVGVVSVLPAAERVPRVRRNANGC